MQGIIVILLVLGVMIMAARERRQQDVGDNLLAESNSFFLNLTKSMGVSTSSMVISPYSLHSALTQTIMYAKGPTAVEMQVGLGLKNVPLSKISSLYNKLNRQIQKEDYSSGTQIMDPTLLVICAFFHTILHMSAVNGPDPTQAPPIMGNDGSCVHPEAIRSYLLSQTNDNIELYLPDQLTKWTLLLISTMVVRAEWQDMFDPQKTYKHRFLFLDPITHGSIMVDMMTDVRLVMWKRDDTLTVDVVEVALKGRNLGFYVVLPHKDRGLMDVEKRLLQSGRTLSSLADGLKPTTVRLGIPEMRLFTQLSMKGYLGHLGIARAFSRETADFSRITNYDKLYLSDVIHATTIVVNEEGISTSAATPPRKVANPSQEFLPAQIFIADHPFAFFIRHNHLGRVLISGRCQSTYIGKTERQVNNRVVEQIPSWIDKILHKGDGSSNRPTHHNPPALSIAQHVLETAHVIDRDNVFSVLFITQHSPLLKFAEAIMNNLHRPFLCKQKKHDSQFNITVVDN